MKDLADFRKSEVLATVRYRDDRLQTYLAYEDHWPLLIRNEYEIAGFALVRKSKPETYVIGEFFIKPEFRRCGLGRLAVAQILPKFSGNWEIPFQIENSKGASFWRQTIKKLGYEFTEEQLASDVLLLFTS